MIIRRVALKHPLNQGNNYMKKKPPKEVKKPEKKPVLMHPDTRKQMVWKPFGR
jgi:hypothetical protein